MRTRHFSIFILIADIEKGKVKLAVDLQNIGEYRYMCGTLLITGSGPNLQQDPDLSLCVLLFFNRFPSFIPKRTLFFHVGLFKVRKVLCLSALNEKTSTNIHPIP